jgi:hypothetical protein
MPRKRAESAPEYPPFFLLLPGGKVFFVLLLLFPLPATWSKPRCQSFEKPQTLNRLVQVALPDELGVTSFILTKHCKNTGVRIQNSGDRR